MKRLTLLCFFVWTSHAVFATQPNHWTVSTPDEFLAGDLKGVSITGEGGIVLAPALEQVLDTREAFIHSVVADQAGNVYVATGNQGRIFRVGANGQGAEWAKLAEAGVHALALDSGNRLYAASSPDGKVYRFDNGPNPQVFFDPAEKYIWSLAVDNQNNVFVGTGPKGIIYKVDPQGKSEVFYDSKETHIVTLEWAADRTLLAGTAPGGLIFRFSADGKPFVLHDSTLSEIKAIATDRYGNIYAAALSGAPSISSSSTSDAADSPAKPKTLSVNQSKETEDETVETGGESKGPKKTEIYRIDKNNRVEIIYSSNDGLTYDVVVRPDGNVLVATSNKGRIVSIDPRRFPTYLAQTTEEQVTQLIERSGRLYAATSNLGKVFLVGGKSSAAATYESKVFDAGMTASWGSIRWQSKGSGQVPGIRIFTRSGNTSNADQTWTSWDGPYPDGGSAPIKSAPARFIQWKVEFPEKSGAISPGQSEGIDMVTVSYLQQNLAPQLSSLTVHSAGVAFAEFPGAAAGGGVSPGGPDRSHLVSLPRAVREIEKTPVSAPARKIYYPGARSLSWTASDPNQDDLVYALSIRRQGEQKWVVLKEDLTETHHTIDGASLPSGVYFAKVTASDRLSNPTGQALETELFSKAFVIANDLPLVEISPAQIQGRAANLQFSCKSNASTIHQAEYSVDGREWNIVFPSDGIADTETEQYTLKLDNLSAGEHQVWIRVVDSVGNISTGKTNVSVQ
ncbi:MAG: hypothetical protein EHM61_04085 [Acidobacteria bacterium]|nr:MAG: hypothetical protein EHM61_04085 [Acidobacteriota bacterium]